MLINIIIGVVAAVAIAVYMGMLKKGVVFLMLLLPLRQYCGGYHMKNHNKCIVASIIIYFLQLMLIKNLKVTISVQIVMLIFALVIILMLAPVDNINNKMNYEEKKSSPNLCVNSSFSYVVLSTLLLSSRDLTEWSLVYHSTLSYQRFYDLHSIHYDHLEGLHQLI